MNRFSQRFLVDLFGVLLILSVLTAIILYSRALWNESSSRSPGSIYNSQDQGAQSLMWQLSALGYWVDSLDTSIFQLSSNDSLLFVLAPERQFTGQETSVIDSWVQAGGTLILAQESNRQDNLLAHYDLRLRLLWPGTRQARLTLPTFNWPLVDTAEVRASRRLQLNCGQAAVHIGDCEKPILVSFGRGRGQVFIISTLYPFTNEGLTKRGNTQLVQNLVSAIAAPGATILFDESHHDDSLPWLIATPEGQALIFTLLIIILYVWLNSRTIKPPSLPAKQEVPERRETAEFISFMAKGERHLGGHEKIRSHYWQRFKRKAARRYGIDPALSEEAFLAELIPYYDEREISTMLYLTTTIDHPDMSEVELRHWVDTAIRLSSQKTRVQGTSVQLPV